MDTNIKQILFTTAYLGLMAQGSKSADACNNCLYRTPSPEGCKKCGIGMCIADRFYDAEALENRGVNCYEVWKAVADTFDWDVDLLDDPVFLERLQSELHDNINDMGPNTFRDCLQRAAGWLADAYHLTMPPDTLTNEAWRAENHID